MKPHRQLAIAVLRLYQWCVSPLLGTRCRFEPSCSHYAIHAIGHHGLLTGAWLTAKRLLRCQPWGGSGFDPIPAKPQK